MGILSQIHMEPIAEEYILPFIDEAIYDSFIDLILNPQRHRLDLDQVVSYATKVDTAC